MSRASCSIAYDGEALREGAMDVRDLAPALLAVGQMFDAANTALNGDQAKIRISVTATGIGSFEIVFEIMQSFPKEVLDFLIGDVVTAAINLKELILTGTAGSICLLALIRKLRGRKPDRIERIAPNTVRVVIGSETFDVPLKLLRLYQDIAVRTAVQKVVEEPLKSDGIDVFEVRENKHPVLRIGKNEAPYYARPDIPDETLVDQRVRRAFSIISLAFKDDNKWRLHDGSNQISALIEDQDFLQKVDDNRISFSKGDILLCDVKVTQKRTTDGLKTEYIVEQVVEHRPAARQIPMPDLFTSPPASPEPPSEPPPRRGRQIDTD